MTPTARTQSFSLSSSPLSHKMDTMIQQPGKLLTDIPTILPSPYSYTSHISSQEIRWKRLHMPNDFPRQFGNRRASLDLPELLKDTLRLEVRLQDETPKKRVRRTQLQDLPEEIQQGVLDMLMGSLSSTSSSITSQTQGMRNWSTAMRHPRGRHHSDLALVSRTWRRMIQERLYRHGAYTSLSGAMFLTNKNQ